VWLILGRGPLPPVPSSKLLFRRVENTQTSALSFVRPCVGVHTLAAKMAPVTTLLSNVSPFMWLSMVRLPREGRHLLTLFLVFWGFDFPSLPHWMSPLLRCALRDSHSFVDDRACKMQLFSLSRLVVAQYCVFLCPPSREAHCSSPKKPLREPPLRVTSA